MRQAWHIAVARPCRRSCVGRLSQRAAGQLQLGYGVQRGCGVAWPIPPFDEFHADGYLRGAVGFLCARTAVLRQWCRWRRRVLCTRTVLVEATR